MVANVFPIDQLTDDAKRGLLVALVRDLSRAVRDPLRIADPQGDLFIHSIPADSRELAERARKAAGPEYMERLRQAASTPERSLEVADFLAAVREGSIGQPSHDENATNGAFHDPR